MPASTAARLEELGSSVVEPALFGLPTRLAYSGDLVCDWTQARRYEWPSLSDAGARWVPSEVLSGVSEGPSGVALYGYTDSTGWAAHPDRSEAFRIAVADP